MLTVPLNIPQDHSNGLMLAGMLVFITQLILNNLKSPSKILLIGHFFLVGLSSLISQNLIENSSFSEWVNPHDTSKYKYFNFGKLSDITNWYIPKYITQKVAKDNIENYYHCLNYFSSKELSLYHKKYFNEKFYLSELIHKNNAGFASLSHFSSKSPAILQQKFTKPIKAGNYLLTFKIKFESLNDNKRLINVCISPNDLKNYFFGRKFVIPTSKINFRALPQYNYLDYNTPWLIIKTKLYLNGNEKYITIFTSDYEGMKHRSYQYFIDDIELVKVENDSITETEFEFEKENIIVPKVEFQLDTLTLNDSLLNWEENEQSKSLIVGYAPLLLKTKIKLLQLINFLKRNNELKVEVIFYDSDKTLPLRFDFYTIKNFLCFNGIAEDRILYKKYFVQDNLPTNGFFGNKFNYFGLRIISK